MSINQRRIPLETVQYSGSEQSIDIVQEPTERLDFVLSGTLHQAGVDGGASIRDEALQRLIPRMRIVKDGFFLLDSDLRGIFQRYIRTVLQVPAATDPAIGGGAGDIPFRLPFSYYFTGAGLKRPFDLHLPRMNVKRNLQLMVQWSTENAGNSSDNGSGAIVTGGGVAYTWTTEPTLTVTQVTVPRAGIAPRYLPVFESFDLPTFAAANSRLSSAFDNGRKFWKMLIRSAYGSETIAEDSINYVTLKSAGERFVDKVPFAELVDRDKEAHPGIGTETGYLAFPDFTNGGLLNGAVDPNALTDLRLELDVSAPTSGDGQVRVYEDQIVPVDGLTVMGS